MRRLLCRAMFLALVPVLVGAFIAPAHPAIAATSPGLRNAGFEQGLTEWQQASGAAEAVAAVRAEGPSAYSVYRSIGVTVTPFEGSTMLRVGTPAANGSQPKGTTTVSQTFTPASSTLAIAVRVFSWEYRGGDSVVIDLTDSAGHHVGSLSPPVAVTMTDGSVIKSSTMPMVITPSSSQSTKLLDTGWITAKITGIPTSAPLKLSYSLQTPKDTQHPTWAYFDKCDQPPTVVGRTYTTDENTALSLAAPGLLGGAVDPDGDTVQASGVGSPAHGTLVVRLDGSFLYTPAANYYGPDSFTFKANDGTTDSNVAAVSITVKRVNHAPAAVSQSVITDENTMKPVTLSATDADNDQLTYTVVAGPAHGILSGTAPNLTYRPTANYYGPDSFKFKANDGAADSNIAVVSITVRKVNHAPMAVSQSVVTDEDAFKLMALSATDIDNDPLIYTIVMGPEHGLLIGPFPGLGALLPGLNSLLLYVPNADYNGADSFTFKAYDGAADSNIAVVSITVKPVNDPPVAQPRTVATDKNKAVGVKLIATDVDGDSLTYAVVRRPAHGTLSGTAPNLTYTPATNYVGPDSFTFKANDGKADSNTAVVSITVKAVNTAPVAVSQSILTDEDTMKPVSLSATDAENDPLTYSVVVGPAHGTLSGMAPNLTYTPNANYRGMDSFTFKANDGLADSNIAVVTITVNPVDHAPAAFDVSATTNAGKPVKCSLNATDVDGDPLTFEIVHQPEHGDLVLDGNVATYTPRDSFFGTDTFSYRAAELQGLRSGAATVTITVDPLAAVFEYMPTDPREGENVSVFGDLSRMVDPQHSILTWSWSVSGPSGFADAFDGENSLFMPPQEGSYDVSLTVTDDRGATATTHTVIPVINDPPRVKALNVEVMPGRPATVLGRFLDAGWTDSHPLVSVSAPGAGAATLAEDHIADLSSGIVTAPLTTEVGGQGTLTVGDDGGGSASASFSVTVVPPGTDRSSSGDTLADRNKPTFPKARGDGSYLSYIKSSGDVDLYEVVMPDGSSLPYGTEVLANLKELPADYDLAILSELPSGLDQSLQDMQNIPLDQGSVSASYGRMSYGRMSYGRMSYGRMSYGRMSYGRMSDGRYDTLDVNTWPLSEMAYTGLENANVSGGDVTLSELGLTIPPNADITMASFSANHGLQDETALARTESIGNRIYVAVFGANGAFSDSEPYTLQVETSKPEDVQAITGGGTPQEQLVADDQSTSEVATLGPVSAEKMTLFVTQAQRLTASYGAAAWGGVLSSLETLSARSDVQGEILSLPSDIYDAWDTDPYAVDKANAVSEQIRAIVQARLNDEPSLRYVVFVGDDRIVPFHRTPDDTLIGNESYYADESWVQPDSPLYASMASRNFLTDDYYVDASPIPWQGRALYVPDVAVSRLVERPEEITRTIDAFIANNGQLTPSKGFVSGYDFFADGSQAVADTMQSGLIPVDELISSTWNADQLRQQLTGSAHQLNDVSAHFTQFLGVSAAGFAAYDTNDAFKSVELALPQSSLEGDLVYTLGCHAGMSVPDSDAVPADASFGVDTSLDFPQAMARQGATYVGNTGFGLGDSEGIALSELLTQYFTEDLLQDGGTTVGDAMLSSKQRYVLSASTLTAYDEKASAEFTLYGLPQYKINTSAGPLAKSGGGASAIQAAGMAQRTSSAISTAAAGDFTLTVDGSATLHELVSYLTTPGTYYTADGNTQESDSRSIQPKVVEDLEPTSAGAVHGVLLMSGSFSDQEPFDPVIARTVTGWDRDVDENQVSADGFWPASPVTLKSLSTSSTGLLQSLVLVPGQFRSTAAEETTVTGVERLWHSLSVELNRSDSSDWAPPQIDDVKLYLVSPTKVAVSIGASDAAGIGRIVVSRLTGTGLESVSLTPSDPNAGRYVTQVDVPPGTAPEDLGFMIQAADRNGNVAVSTGKGAVMHLVQVSVPAQLGRTWGQPTTVVAYLPDYASLAQPVSYSWDFGDGESSSGVLPSVLATGAFDVSHLYASTEDTQVAVLTVTDALGGVATVQTVMAPAPMPIPDVSLRYPVPNATVSGVVTLTADASDLAGVARTDFLLDSTFLGSSAGPDYFWLWDSSSATVGLHTLTARAFNVLGLSSETTIEVTVVHPDHTPPSVSLVLPASSSSVSGMVSIVATAYDNESGIDSVWLKVDGSVVGTAVVPPYAAMWDATGSYVGTHTIEAVAYDGAGNSASDSIVVFVVPPAPAVVYVSPSGDDTAGVGTEASPLRTITRGLATVAESGTVNVAAGDYHENLLVTRSVTIDGGYSGTRATLTGAGNGSAVEVTGTKGVTIEGLRVTGGGAIGPLTSGGGIRARSSSVVVSSCVIGGNRATAGGGIMSSGSTAHLTVINSVVASNTSTSTGGGVYAPSGTMALINDTIVDNSAGNIAGGVGRLTTGGSITVFNSIVCNNAVGTSSIDIAPGCDVAYTYTTSSYTASPTAGPGNLSGADGPPLFADEAGGDYSLQPGSVCIDAGAATYGLLSAPVTDILGNPRPYGLGWDMGAFERQVSPSPPVVFMDSHLESAVRDALGISSPTPVTQTDMLNLTTLACPYGSGVSNLEGLQYAMKLGVLVVPGDSITSLSPVSGDTSLTTLNLHDTHVADFSALPTLTGLQTLDLYNTTLPNLAPLSSLTNLTSLNIGGNGISNILALSGFTGLHTLWISNSGISDISALSGLTNLTYLDMGGNSIGDLSALSGLSGLQSLRVESNDIQDISVLDNKLHLIYANLTSNYLDITPGSDDMEVISDVEGRGATVDYSPQLSGSPPSGSHSAWKTVATGLHSVAAIKNDGSLWTWGYNVASQLGDGTTTDRSTPKHIGIDTDWALVAVGTNHMLAVKRNGTLWAWGQNSSGQLGDETTSTRSTPEQIGTDTDWAAVSAGTSHSLALKRDGSVWAWGGNNDGQLGNGTFASTPTPTEVATGCVSISAGTLFSAAVRRDGMLLTWGLNSSGQLGDGTHTNRSWPTMVGADQDWVAASAGGSASTGQMLGIKRDGSLWAWGSNSAYQLSDSISVSGTPAPARVGSRNDWVSVSAGQSHSAALTRDGSLWLWGANGTGQQGDSTTVTVTAPKRLDASTDWLSVCIQNSNQTFALKLDGTLWAWGQNLRGQIGNGTSGTGNYVCTPFAVGMSAWASALGDWVKLSEGYAHTLAIRQDGTLWAWGAGGTGQLGLGTLSDHGTPVRVGSDTHWIDVRAGNGSSYGLKRDGSLWAWGGNALGQLGDGTSADRTVPTRVGADADWESISVGWQHVVALKRDGSLWAWGDNTYGQLGDGMTPSSVATPTQVGTATDWESVSAGQYHNLAIKRDGTLWAWGLNANGELGTGVVVFAEYAPVHVGFGAHWQEVSAGRSSAALRGDGTLWTWGANELGQLGDGTYNGRNTPGQVGTATDWRSVCSGGYHMLARRGAGQLWAWGDNAYGQLGLGLGPGQSNTPGLVAGDTWTALAGGWGHSGALKANGSLWAWGYNSYGEVGNGSLANVLSPTLVGLP